VLSSLPLPTRHHTFLSLFSSLSTPISFMFDSTMTSSLDAGFKYHLHHLNSLELWYELAVRPEKDECDKDDLDLLANEADDCEELARRCLQARKLMNENLPHIELASECYLVPRESTIPNAGLGLFYDPINGSKILEGSVLCTYSGHRHNFRSIKTLDDRRYLMLVEGDVLIDAGPLMHIKARYINDPLNDDLVNCKFVPEKESFRAAIVATRLLEPGEELFVSYGDAYWSQQVTRGNVKV
jgi:hypothetical protein